MKKLFVVVLLVITALGAFTATVAADEPGIMGVNTFNVAPVETGPGNDIAVNLVIQLTAGPDGTTSMCVYIPTSGGTPLIDPPASFSMEYGLGSTATFNNAGSCFAASSQLAIRYTATGLPTAQITYSGALLGTVNQIPAGNYNWSVLVFEASGDGGNSASTSSGVLEPTAISMDAITVSGPTLLPGIVATLMVLLSLGALFSLNRRFNTIIEDE